MSQKRSFSVQLVVGKSPLCEVNGWWRPMFRRNLFSLFCFTYGKGTAQ